MKIVRGVLSAVMLLIFVSAAGLWARSYFVTDSLRRGTESHFIHVTSAAGRIVLTRAEPAEVVEPDEQPARDEQPMQVRGPWSYDRGGQPHQFVAAARFGQSVWSRVGFGYSRQNIRFPHHMTVANFATPHWLICLIALPLALRWMTRARAVDESATLECPACGQMFTQVPADCPVCGHRLIASSSPGAPDA